MKGSTAAAVSKCVNDLPERSFVAVRDIEGPRRAVESAFSRLACSGQLARVRKGLYWKGVPTPFGMSPPRAEDAALAIGGLGAGLAGVAAAHALGLTTQMPSTIWVAVPGQVPAGYPGLRFVQRPVRRLVRAITHWEVAVLEVLRAGSAVMERGWDDLASRIAELSEAGCVRIGELCAAVAEEPHRQARQHWGQVLAARPDLAESP